LKCKNELRYHVTLVRATLSELHDHSSLEGDNQRLFYKGREVAVVYFRAGYTPNDYLTENEWMARSKIEKSFAVKCPAIEYHLAGTKKVQQALAKPGVLERFVTETRKAEKLRSCFAGLYPLDSSPDGIKGLELGMTVPENYVLKPQREGGGKLSYALK
jgi:glutathione synthetase